MQAILGDPRNDENLMIAGMHAAFLLFHNEVVDGLRRGLASSLSRRGRRAERRHRWQPGPSRDPRLLFLAARLVTTWHYQYIVLNEFLPKIVGQDVVNDVRNRGTGSIRPPRGQAFIPVEFQSAAYRFGHSMVRPSYRANLAGRQRRSRSSASSSTPAAGGEAPTRSTCGEAPAPRGGSSAGRPSSTSATGSAPQQAHRRQALHARCSTSLWGPSRAASRRRRWRSATCCAT